MWVHSSYFIIFPEFHFWLCFQVLQIRILCRITRVIKQSTETVLKAQSCTKRKTSKICFRSCQKINFRNSDVKIFFITALIRFVNNCNIKQNGFRDTFMTFGNMSRYTLSLTDSFIGVHSLSTYAKFSEKLIFFTP